MGGSQLAKLGNPLETELDKILKTPGYEARVSFIEQFHKDFKKVVDAYAGDSRLYIFIDDLDRCDVPRAAELIQAINLLIDDDPRLVFILGMDRDKVAAGIVAKYASVLTYLQGGDGTQPKQPLDKLQFGYDFLEKFIQIQFRLPQPRVEGLKSFLAELGRPAPRVAKVSWMRLVFRSKQPDYMREADIPTGLVDADVDATTKINRRAVEIQLEEDSESVTQVAVMVAPVFGNNPRRLKQFLNLFRLTTLICVKLGLFDEVDGHPGLTFPQLGKFVAILMTWPGFLREVQADKRLLVELYEESGLGGENKWLSRARFKYLVRYGVQDEERHTLLGAERYSLAQLDVDSLLRVTAPVVRPKPGSQPAPQETSADEQRQEAPGEEFSAELGFSASAEAIPSTVPAREATDFNETINLLAAEYEGIRKAMPAGDERTERMTAMVRKARTFAQSMPYESMPLDLFFKGTGSPVTSSAGTRIVALAFAQQLPKPAYLPIAIEGIVRPESAFEQFQALSLARWLFDILNVDEREQLRRALLEQEGLQIDENDSSRWNQRQELLAKLGETPRPHLTSQ